MLDAIATEDLVDDEALLEWAEENEYGKMDS